MENKKSLTKLLLFTLIVIAILVLNGCFGWSKYLSNMDNLSFLQEVVNNNFLLAIFIYNVLTIIGCVVLALPGITFAVIAGVLFGPIIGIFACLVATTLGAMLAFLAARFF